MTDLNKPVKRKTNTMIRDRGRLRQIMITIYPNGTIGLRPMGTRQEEVLTMESCYSLAVKQRVAKERIEKLAAKKAKKRG